MTGSRLPADLSDALITVSSPRSPVSEAYRTLRTNLQFASLDTAIRTLVVTSPGPDEGKSTTLANLAVTMAQSEKRVVLIDCDLRRPCLHRFFGVANDTGLTTLIVDEKALNDPPLRETGIDGLLLLPSGPLPPRPPDLLGSRRMETVISSVRDRCDIVLFDTPPVIAVTDAAVLATKVDGVLLVVSAGNTGREQAHQAIETLQKVNARIIGAVVNNVDLDTSMNRYYSADDDA